jgi:type II secretory pathway pseudopilin PulG
MKASFLQTKRVRGFTIIESLVFLFIFALISVVFFETYTTGTRMIIESKRRLGATALANQKMEIIRSIEYDTIGTTDGIPSGELLEDETISVNTVQYHVHTFAQYVDDAFDGTAAAGTDAIPTDYKRVRITVAWGNEGEDQTVVIFGNFSPKGVETSGGGGVLSINVLDSSGSGVTGAGIHVVNTSAGVDFTGTTDSTGNLMLPGAPAGTENYSLTVSKSGYYGAVTYPPYPTTSFHPVDVHASVVAGVLNQKTIVMDQSSDISVITEDPFGTVIPNIDYTLSGGRILGVDNAAANVYGFSDTGTTDSSGEAAYPDESYGEYTWNISSTDYEFYKFFPAGTVENQFTATAGTTANMTAIVLDKNIGSVKIKVQSQSDSTVLSGASVHMTNTTLGYDATVTTDQYGYAYFPTALPELANGTYDITVSLSGYTDKNDTVTINGVLEKKTISLTSS